MDEETNGVPPPQQPKKRSPEEIRNLIGFWILGLTNNFAYIVMLSCAHDILTPPKPDNVTIWSGYIVEHCNPMGTGVILLANILPALLMKILAPIILQRLPYMIRVCCVIMFSLSSFILVAMGSNTQIIISIIGVVCASSAYGLGETTYLGLMSHFDKGMVSSWSSGTGAAGVLGTASYAGILALGVSPNNYLIMISVVPLLMAISYFLILTHPNRKLLRGIHPSKNCTNRPITNDQGGVSNSDPANEETGVDSKVEIEVKKEKTFKEKLKILKPLSRFMVPIFFIYFLEYVINHALFELLQFDVSWMSVHEQYRWYLATFFLGVFLARSSVNLVHIKHTWIFPILQTCVLTILLTQIFFKYIPYIIIVFFIILFEGMLCGAGYVNTFYSILKYMDKDDHELGTSITCMGDSLGITLAALAATQIHNSICSL